MRWAYGLEGPLRVGDASGNPITFPVRVPAEDANLYLFIVLAAQLEVTGNNPGVIDDISLRILTNMPPADTSGLAGVEVGFHAQIPTTGAPAPGVIRTVGPLVVPPVDKLILGTLSPVNSTVDILELGGETNTATETYTGQAYGWFYDKLALLQPGGLRFPGEGT